MNTTAMHLDTLDNGLVLSNPWRLGKNEFTDRTDFTVYVLSPTELYDDCFYVGVTANTHEALEKHLNDVLDDSDDITKKLRRAIERFYVDERLPLSLLYVARCANETAAKHLERQVRQSLAPPRCHVINPFRQGEIDKEAVRPYVTFDPAFVEWFKASAGVK